MLATAPAAITAMLPWSWYSIYSIGKSKIRINSLRLSLHCYAICLISPPSAATIPKLSANMVEVVGVCQSVVILDVNAKTVRFC